MTVVAVERHEGRVFTTKDGEKGAVRVFRVFTGDASLRSEWGILSIGINRYDAYPGDSTMLAIEASSEPVSGELGVFDVTYSYSNRPTDTGTTGGDSSPSSPGGNDPITQPNPLLRIPEVSWGQGSRTKPWLKDWSQPDRKPIQNSAGMQFEGQEIEDITCPVSIMFNISAAVDIVLKQLQYANRINNADFFLIPWYTPYPQGTMRCNAWTGDLKFEAGFGFYLAAKVDFEFHPEGWDREFRDQGYYYRDPANGEKLTKNRNPLNGFPIDGLVDLDGNGHLNTTGVPVYLTFRPFRWTSFANIFAAS